MIEPTCLGNFGLNSTYNFKTIHPKNCASIELTKTDIVQFVMDNIK